MKKRISVALAAAILVLSLSGCNGSSSTENTGKTENTSSVTNSAVDGNSYATWKDIDRNKVIAHVEGADSEKFDITFGEFYSEYLYYLLSYNIDDDMSATYKDACETYREDIITYLTFERIFMEIAEEKGCGISSLTDEEKATIKANTETTLNNFVSNYSSIAAEELGEGASDDDVLNRATEMLVSDLARAELTTAIFEKWETNNFIQEKLTAVLNEGITVSEEEIDAMFEEYVAMAKTALETNKAEYETNSTFTWIYKPEGTRLADQILVAFDSETQSKISEARNAGNDEEADKLRNDAYNAEIQEKVNNIMSLIESGSDFNELQATYNDDGGDEPYPVIVGSQIYVQEFTDAVFSVDNIGDVAAPAVSDYGVHIIKYEGDDVVTEEDLVEIRKSMSEFILSQKQTSVQQEAYEEWLDRFPYTVDYDLLQVTVDADETDVLQ